MERRDIPALITVCAVTVGAFLWTLREYRSPVDLPLNIEFAKTLPPNIEIKGFSHQEGWGRWTEGHEASIRFLHSLPAGFRLRMRIKGFGPNIGQSIRVRCDSVVREIVVGKEMATADMDFSSIGAGKHTLKIEIPYPASPAQLGINADQRLLGVGIESIIVLPLQ
jgi:phosphoglycerol transferase